MKIRHCEKEESIYTREQAVRSVRSVREARVRAVRGVRAVRVLKGTFYSSVSLIHCEDNCA
ncbi:hypothetical protein T08_4828 [Trichinella sp. T8]|nr:hypothetical protein T08_4828 [Trichinella sp. T8]